MAVKKEPTNTMYTEFNSNYPTKIEINKAVALILDQKYQDALKILKTLPVQTAESCYYTAVALYKNAKIDDIPFMVQYAQMAVNMEPDNEKYVHLLDTLSQVGPLTKATEHINNNNFSEAIKVLNSMEKRFGQWHYLMANALLENGTSSDYTIFETAKFHANEAYRLEPDKELYEEYAININRELAYHYASLYINEGKYDEAIKLLKEMPNKTAKCNYLISNAYIFRGKGTDIVEGTFNAQLATQAEPNNEEYKKHWNYVIGKYAPNKKTSNTSAKAPVNKPQTNTANKKTQASTANSAKPTKKKQKSNTKHAFLKKCFLYCFSFAFFAAIGYLIYRLYF